MPNSGFFLSDDDARMLRGMQEAISNLERQTAERFAPGMFIPSAAPVRSPKWSDSHIESVGSLWTHHYQLNELNTSGYVFDRTENEAFKGLIAAETPVGYPQQGQIGGLQSEGSYSYYFPGKEKSRIDLPLLTTKFKSVHIEVVFKPQVIPQLGMIFYNGNYTMDGWGLVIEGGFGFSGKFLCIRYGNSLFASTGIELVAEQWHCVNMWVTEAGVVNVVVASLNPNTKIITVSTYTGSPVLTAPTTRSVIGNGSPTASNSFKGWVDELSVYEGNIPLTEVVNSYYDRWRTALEASPPPGFVLPDGTAVSRAEFDRLFKVIGTIYGAGDGSSTFNLPDLRNRVPLGRESEDLGALLTKQFGTAGTVFTLLNVNWILKV